MPDVSAVEGVSVAFDADGPFDDTSPEYTRLDDRNGVHVVTDWSIDRGRQSELDKHKTGTANVNVVDKNGVLDPTNATGPFFQKLDPVKPAAIALRNPVADASSTLFTGHTGDLELDLDLTEKFFTGSWTWNDAFEIFTALEMTPKTDSHGFGTVPVSGSLGDIYFPDRDGGGDLIQVDDRINELLTDAGYPIGPTGWRNIFSGNVWILGNKYARMDQLLTALFDAADAEFPGVANLFMSKLGVVTFHGRFARFNFSDYADNGITVWNAGDAFFANGDDSMAVLSALKLRRSKDDILNAAIALPMGVPEASSPKSLYLDGSGGAVVGSSNAKYGWRSISFLDLLTRGGSHDGLNRIDETKLFAKYYVDNYKLPSTRLSTISFQTINPSRFSAAATWALLCGLELSDVINVNTTHPGGGGINEPYYVEGIRYSATPLGLSDTGFPNVRLDVDLSPQSLYTQDPFS